MLRRGHKKSRGGCLECKRRHVKCDQIRPRCRLCTVSERECSFASQAPQERLPNSNISSPSVSPGSLHNHGAATARDDTSLTPATPYKAELLPINEPSGLGETINFNHMELLVHLTASRDIFSLGVGLEDYESGLSLGLRTGLGSPYLMYQMLAYSAQHLASLHSERSESYLRQAVNLQTRAVSLFTAVPIEVDQSNCMPILLFSSILGHHMLADTLGKRDSGGLSAFIAHYVQCAQTYRGVYNIAISTWPLLIKSELGPIISLSKDFTSRQPKGNDCQQVSELVDGVVDLSEEEKKSCRVAIQYLQVGLDAAFTAEDVPPNRYQMISEWTMLVPPEFTGLLAASRPEALVILAHYAMLLHYGRHLWQVGNAGAYILGIIGEFLGPEWDPWLRYPRQMMAQTPNEV